MIIIVKINMQKLSTFQNKYENKRLTIIQDPGPIKSSRLLAHKLKHRVANDQIIQKSFLSSFNNLHFQFLSN